MSRTVQAFWVSAGNLASLLATLGALIVIARNLDKVSVATFRQVSLVYATLSVVFLAGLPAAFSYYLPRSDKLGGGALIRKLAGTLFLLGVIFGLVIFVASEPIAGLLGNNRLAASLKIFSLIPPFLFPVLGLDGILATIGKTEVLARYMCVTRLGLFICISTPIALGSDDIESAIVGWVVATVLSCALSAVIVIREFPSVLSRRDSLVSLGSVLAFTSPLALAGVFGALLKAADQFYISRYFGPDAFAIYSISMVELPFVAMLTSAMATVLLPAYSRLQNESAGPEQFLQLWKAVIRKAALLVYPIVTYCFVFSEEILLVLFSDEYSAGENYFRLGLVLNYFNVIVFAPLVLSLGKSGDYARGHVAAAAVAWLGGLVLVSQFESILLVGAFFVAVKVSLVIWFIFYLAREFRSPFISLFPVKMLLGLLLMLALCAQLAGMASDLFARYGVVVQLGIGAVIYGLLTMLAGKLSGVDFAEPIAPILNRLR